jgi:YD repeat-containing protein
MDVYTPNGAGGFNSPYRIYNTLTLLSANHYELSFPDGSVYVYSIPGGTTSQQPFLTAIRDAYGNTLSLAYNSNIQLTIITTASGDVFTLGYNSSGLVTNVADAFGRNATFQYDTNKNLIQITDMGGYWSSFTYDTNVFLTGITDARGTWNVKTQPADGIPNGSNPYPQPGTAMWQNYRVTITNPLGQSEEYQYNGYSHYSWYVSPHDYVPYSSPSLNNFQCRLTRAWDLGERVEFPKESVFQLRNEFKNFAVSSVI